MRTNWRVRLEGLVGRLSDDMWAWIVSHDYVTELDSQPAHLETIAQELREMLRAARSSPPRTGRLLTARPQPEMSRAEAASRLRAVAAGQDEEVREFRARHLNSGTIRVDEVEAWIQRQVAQAPTVERYYEIPVGPNVGVTHQNGTVRFSPGLTGPYRARVRVESLEFPKEGWTGRVPIGSSGVLRILRDLGTRLASEFDWQPGQATAFVLTGAVPLVDDVRARESTNWSTGLARVTLDVDPRVSPAELARIYSKVRRRVVGPRHRDLSARHLRLAVFGAEANPAETWAARMARWNREAGQRPGWRYTRAQNFARDCTQAIRRMRDWAMPESRDRRQPRARART